MYVRRELQHLIEPLIVSWGYHATPDIATGSRFGKMILMDRDERSDGGLDRAGCYPVHA